MTHVYRWAESVGMASLPGRQGEPCQVVVRAGARGGPRNVMGAQLTMDAQLGAAG